MTTTPVSHTLRRRLNTKTVPEAGSVSGLSIGQYLIRRLRDYGVRDVFGIPGDYVLTFYNLLANGPVRVVGCTREDCAGFAADAYARINGMGAVCVTYCVGGLSLCNSIAGAYAEKSPVVVISGSPGLGERINNPLLHHRVKDFRTQLDVFDKLCVATADLSDARIAFHEIDRVLDAAMRYKRPVYIELPRDMVNVKPETPYQYRVLEAHSDPDALTEAVKESVEWISSAKRPCILAGVEIHRFNLEDDVLALAEGSQIAIAADILGKSVISEVHPLYVGLYEGALGREEVTRFVEASDCLIMLGTFMTDINLGIFTANLDPRNCIYATSEQLRIRHHHFHNVLLEDYIRELAKARPKAAARKLPPQPQQICEKFELRPSAPITITRLMARLNDSLDSQTVVIADVGDAMFSATELCVRERTEFLAPAYYTSMGFAVPAALGAHVARPDMRVVAVVGDGAFQMTGMELSTVVRYGFAPIVIVLDNKGYGTERFLHPGDFNDINPWKYHRLPEILGGGRGYEVRTEGEFDEALRAAWNDKGGLSLIQVHLGLEDRSTALDRLAQRLSKRV